MIRRGLLIWVLLMLCGALVISLVWTADALVIEFREQEAVETLTVSEIGTYDPNGAGGIYLHFRYRSTVDGAEYESAGVYTKDHSYQVGDAVTVVTRDGAPKQILSQTARGRQRTAPERALDAALQTGGLQWCLIVPALLLGIGLPTRKTVSAELKARKKFACVTSVLFAAAIAFACFYMVLANHESGWEGLGDFMLFALTGAGSALALLILWIVDSVRRKRKQNG